MTVSRAPSRRSRLTTTRPVTHNAVNHTPHDAALSASENGQRNSVQATVSPTWPVRDETIVLHNVTLESGAVVERVEVYFRLEGQLAPTRDNVVLVVHALTGTAHASQWWKGVIEGGGAIDPTTHAVLCANLLGGCNGTTGPTNEQPDALPTFTTRDQAHVLALLLDALGVDAPVFVCGGSLGGMVTLEFAASFPDRVSGAVVLAAPAAQTAQGAVWGSIMQRAVEIGGPERGLALARMVGMLSYRTAEGLEQRFGGARSEHGDFLANEWLASHGEKLVQRFNAASYTSLLTAMDHHDVGRGRGGIAAALAPVADRLTGVGIPGDLLYPAESVSAWTSAVSAQYVNLPSVHGHDGFLLETERVSVILRDAIARATIARAAIARTAIARASSDIAASTAALPAHGVQRSASRVLRVALAGCGHVGGGLLQLIAESREHSANVSRRARALHVPHDATDIHIERVLVRDARRVRPHLQRALQLGVASPAGTITDASLLINDDIDVLVEAIGGTTTARVLVVEALRRGIRVVTANKALLALYGVQLTELARAHNTRIDFEGAVGGAIPVIRSLRTDAAGVGITRLSGILNGTSNFVLEQVSEGVPLKRAVAIAQELGYAEADPTRDLSGEDAEDKLRILTWLAFGIDPASITVVRRGIDADTASWAQTVATDGDRVKLIASCSYEDGALEARVVPTRVSAADPWTTVTGANNRIVVESESAGTIIFQGAGAGGRETAGALLSDVLSPMR